MVQNQVGNHPLRWDKRGTIVKCEGFDQYQVMIDGSRRLTRRNRKYLRMFTPFQPPQAMLGSDARSAQPRAGAVMPAVSKQASKQPSNGDYLIMFSKMTSANRDMDREVNEPRFQGNMVTSINKRNMEVMPTNHSRNTQSRTQ